MLSSLCEINLSPQVRTSACHYGIKHRSSCPDQCRSVTTRTEFEVFFEIRSNPKSYHISHVILKYTGPSTTTSGIHKPTTAPKDHDLLLVHFVVVVHMPQHQRSICFLKLIIEWKICLIDVHPSCIIVL